MNITWRSLSIHRYIYQKYCHFKQSFSYGISNLLIWLIILLFSGLCLLYTQDMYRRFFMQSQQLQKQYYHLRIEQDKLLLEKAAWSNPSHIQTVAQEKLGMRLPHPKRILLMHFVKMSDSI